MPPTRLGGTQTRFPTTTSSSRSGVSRVATWLAISRVFHFRTPLSSCAADYAHLRSHSGPGAGDAMLGCPTGFEFQLQPEIFRTLVLERLRLPLNVTEETCSCGAALDILGRHRAACHCSGLLKRRAKCPERTLARVCREAGASVRFNAKLRDMNVPVPANDESVGVWPAPPPWRPVGR